MKFMLTFTWAPDARIREEAIERFRKTGGLPPTGVTLLGRWTRADLSGGFDLLEAEDLRKVTEFAYDKGISSSGIRIGFSHGLRRVWSTHTTW
jgi:Protein of unknown function (DUF3303)